MNFKSLDFKIYLGSAYLIVLLIGIFFLFSNFDISDLTSYEFIRENNLPFIFGVMIKYIMRVATRLYPHNKQIQDLKKVIHY